MHKVKIALLVDANIFDKDGNLIAKIERNKTFVNRNFVSDFNRPDEHSLWIKDNHDKQVLYVKLLNKYSLYIEGIFNLPDEVRSPTPPHGFLEINKDYIASPSAREVGDCHYGAGLAEALVYESH